MSANGDPSKSEVVLRMEGLGKDYAGKTALHALTCAVKKGEIVGLLGPNGAGKTTTMKLLLGMLRPTRGAATILGLDCTKDARETKARMGYTPDEPAFYDFLTGRETIDFALNVRGEPIGPAWERLAPHVSALDFAEHLDGATGGYSHGTKKKLALLLALAHAPALLLLDEPTNGLDPPAAARVRALLKEEATRGTSILVSTHLLDMAETLCDRLLVVHKGRLVAEGTPSSVRGERASLEAAFLELVR
jgi:ABC-2 type transport system ATP-binding protein